MTTELEGYPLIGQRLVNTARCDGCGKEVVGHNDFEPIRGLVGSVAEHTDTGGWGAKFYACSRRCAGKAMANALDKCDEPGRAPHSDDIPTHEQHRDVA